MDRRSVTRLAAAAFNAVLVLSCSLLVVSGQELHPNECGPQAVSVCYEYYRQTLWRFRDREGGAGVDDEAIGRQCSELKAKLECHRKIAACPEEVRSNFSRQEMGYEALRDFFCDKNAARDYYTATLCQDGEKFHPCHDKHMEGVTPENTPDPTCKLSSIAVDCYETAFKSDCSLPLDSAKAAILKGEKAVMLLADCNGSARAFSAPGRLLVAVAALVLVRWASFSWF